MPQPDFEAWAMFAAVADLGSFRAAAEATGVSVPTVSKGIARLERRSGVALFHRTSRRVTLTAAGAGLVDHARAIVASGIAAEEAARTDAVDLAGPIRMTAPLSLGIARVGEPLAAFMAAHPRVTVDCVLSDARCDLVADGIDFALRIAVEASSDLLTQSIAPMPATLLASPAYLARHGHPEHPRDLSGHRLLGYGHERRAVPVRLIGPGEELVTVTPDGPLFVNNGEMMLPTLLAGAGMAMLPEFIAAAPLADGRLVRVMKDWTPPLATLSLVSPPSRLRPARVEALMAHLLGALRADCREAEATAPAHFPILPAVRTPLAAARTD